MIDHFKLLAAGVLSCVVLLACGGHPGASRPSPAQAARQLSEHVSVIHSPDGSTTVLLPVTINGHGPFTFALDTGASSSLVDSSLANQLGLQRTGPAQTVQGVGGVEQALPVKITNWSTGSIKLPPRTVAAAPLSMSPGRRGHGLQGLVGSDIWSTLGKGTFTLDYRDGVLTVYE